MQLEKINSNFRSRRLIRYGELYKLIKRQERETQKDFLSSTQHSNFTCKLIQ